MQNDRDTLIDFETVRDAIKYSVSKLRAIVPGVHDPVPRPRQQDAIRSANSVLHKALERGQISIDEQWSISLEQYKADKWAYAKMKETNMKLEEVKTLAAGTDLLADKNADRGLDMYDHVKENGEVFWTRERGPDSVHRARMVAVEEIEKEKKPVFVTTEILFEGEVLYRKVLK